MSLFSNQTLACPSCATDNVVSVVGSVNADRRPDYRDAILARSFQMTTCTNCGTEFRNEPDFTYLDMARAQWIAALPARNLIDFLDEETRASETFAQSFGARATPEARTIGADLNMRVTFGWPALREKIVAQDLGLDDVTLECMKTDLIRRLDSAPLSPGIDLRLIGLDDDNRLQMMWINALTEQGLESLTLERTLYDAIAQAGEPWNPIRDALTEGPFVDMTRLYLGQGRDAAE